VITDISGMAHSLEIRAPFLDHRLLEFAFSLPRRLKIPSITDPTRNKHVLKRMLEPALPREVLYGPKYGFGYNVPLEALMRGPWSAVVRDLVHRGRYLELDIFSRVAAEWAVTHAPAEAWRLLVFAVWAELFVFGNTVQSLEADIRHGLSAVSASVA
jgi:asparagine synthase (glutamine-hydrolysing)